MNILITGGTGFIGRALINKLKEQHTLTIVTRDIARAKKALGGQINYITLNDLQNHPPSDVVIQLAGENLFSGIFTAYKKKQVLDSRLTIIEELVKYIERTPEHPTTFIVASGIHIYPSDGQLYHEESNYHNSFSKQYMYQLTQSLEQAAAKAKRENCRIVFLRLAVVLDPNGGLLQRIIPLAKLGLGAVLGTGKQNFPWISLNDVVNVIDYVIKHASFSEAVNCVAPQQISQKEFSQELAHHLHRPLFLKIPSALLRLGFGELADELLLNSPYVTPKKLIDGGYSFEYPDLKSFLNRFCS